MSKVDCKTQCEYFGYSGKCCECISNSKLKNNYKHKIKRIRIEDHTDLLLSMYTLRDMSKHHEHVIIDKDLYDGMKKKFGEYLEVED